MAGEEDDDDDYMGDLSQFLPPETLSSSSTKKKKTPAAAAPHAAAPKPKKSKLGLSWQERRRIERDRRQLEEDDRTRANLDEAIPPSNIGFKMLQMMGYNPGSALGKDPTGRTEPVSLEIRRSRLGIGRETPAEERARKEREKGERKRREDREAMEEFGTWQRMQFRNRRMVADYRKAEVTLARLENREEEEEVEVENKDEEKAEEEEEEEVITEEDLRSILMKLRGEHRYCLYCGFQYESTEDLEDNCPGPEEEDH